jgi:hypothetical protein
MLLFFLLLQAVAQTPAYQWPLDLPPQLSSSFAEYRSGRFHAGIDLRTSGTGRDVRAPRAGYVSRLRCSPWGYGRAIYLTLDDGNNVVFGHLQGFDGPLTAYARAAQHQKRDYEIDLYPEPGQFPVHAGQIIAQSGDTGAGPAHLHYELRDSANRPINPRLVGHTWPDADAPVFNKLLVAPRGPNSTVNGGSLPLPIAVRPDGAGGYICDPVAVWGHVGFAADVIDPANGGNNRLGVYELRTQREGRPVFLLRNDQLDYADNGDGIVAFHPLFLDDGRFLLQWRWPGNGTDAFGHAPTDGWMPAPREAGAVMLEAEDFMGNVTRLTVPLVPGEHVLPPEQRGSNLPGKVELECAGTYLVLVAAFPDDEPAIPQLTLSTDGASNPELSFQRVDARTFHAAFAPEPGVTAATFAVEHDRLAPYSERVAVFQNGQADTASFGEVTLSSPAGAAYGTLFARVEPTGLPAAPPVPAAGTAWHIWPEAAPIDEAVEVSFPAPEDAERRTQIYRLAGDWWSPEATDLRDGRLVIQTRRFGTFAPMTDTVAPHVTITAPGAGPVSPYAPVRLALSDKGTGIVHIDAWCGEQWLLMAYDPDAGTASWEQDELLPTGAHTLRVTVRDGCGNETTRTREITVQ